jgi:hypothetical protein
MTMFMAGCATTHYARLSYTHPTAGFERFDDVSYQCGEKAKILISKAQSTGYGEVGKDESVVDCDQFKACMQKQGFTQSTDGPFLTTKDLQLDCK